MSVVQGWEDGPKAVDLRDDAAGELMTAIAEMSDREVRAFVIAVLRRAGMTWPRISTIMRAASSTTRLEAEAFEGKRRKAARKKAKVAPTLRLRIDPRFIGQEEPSR